MLVTLSLKEMSKCKQAATLRWQLARASGVVNQRRDNGRSDADLDLLGVKAAATSGLTIYLLMLRPRFIGVGGFCLRKRSHSKQTARFWYARYVQTSLMLQAMRRKRRLWKIQLNLIWVTAKAGLWIRTIYHHLRGFGLPLGRQI